MGSVKVKTSGLSTFLKAAGIKPLNHWCWFKYSTNILIEVLKVFGLTDSSKSDPPMTSTDSQKETRRPNSVSQQTSDCCRGASTVLNSNDDTQIEPTTSEVSTNCKTLNYSNNNTFNCNI